MRALLVTGWGNLSNFEVQYEVAHCCHIYSNQDFNSTTAGETDIWVAMCLPPCLALYGSEIVEDWGYLLGSQNLHRKPKDVST